MKTTVGELLEKKGHQVWSVSPQTTVYDALHLMAEKDIGATVVMDRGSVAGMFSERDYARKIVLKGRSSKETPVSDIMTCTVCHVRPEITIDECMELMTEKRVRHLPVVQDGKLVGIVSIGDVVKAIIAEQASAVQELEAYVDVALKGKR